MTRILIIRLSSIGDIVMALPVAESLKKIYRNNCEITWLTRECFRDLVDTNEFIDKVLYIENLKNYQFRVIKEIFRIYNKKVTSKNSILIKFWKKFFKNFPVNQIMQSNNYDIVIDLQGSIESVILAMSANSKIIMPYFVNNGTERFAIQRAKNTNIVHRIDEYLDSLNLLENTEISKNFNYGWKIDRNNIEDLSCLKEINYAVIALATQWESKNYPIKDWVKIIKYLNQIKLKVVLVGNNDDKKYIKILNKYIDENCYIDLIGKTTLKELIVVINNSKILLSGDTGAMHIADSLNIPLITLMGPTDPNVWGPYNQLQNVISVNYECKNCYKHKCPLNRICLEDISFDTIKKNIDRILDEDIEK